MLHKEWAVSKDILGKCADATWPHELILLLLDNIIIWLVIAARRSVLDIIVRRDAVGHGAEIRWLGQLIAWGGADCSERRVTVEVEIEPMRNLDLKKYSDEICALLFWYIYYEATRR